MTLPVFQGKGTFTSGVGALSVPMPASVASGDLLLLLVESANQAVATPSGWTDVGLGAGQGTAGAAGGVLLQAFWKIAGGAEGNVAVDDSGDHTSATVFRITGHNATTPIHTFAVTNQSASGTTLTWPSITTSYLDCLIINCCAVDRDLANSSQFSAWTNANLSSLTEGEDNVTSSGTGGGLGLAQGGLATNGSTGATTATIPTSYAGMLATLAIMPTHATAPADGSSSGLAEVSHASGTELAGTVSDGTWTLDTTVTQDGSGLHWTSGNNLDWATRTVSTVADNTQYQLVFTIANLVGGQLRVILNGATTNHATLTPSQNANGTYTYLGYTNQISTASQLLRLQATGSNGTNTFDITYVSVQAMVAGATAAIVRASSGSSAGVGTVDGQGESTTAGTIVAADGSITGAASVSGVSGKVLATGSSITCSATVSATSGATAGTANSITGAGTVTGVSGKVLATAGSIAGVASLSGDASTITWATGGSSAGVTTIVSHSDLQTSTRGFQLVPQFNEGQTPWSFTLGGGSAGTVTQDTAAVHWSGANQLSSAFVNTSAGLLADNTLYEVSFTIANWVIGTARVLVNAATTNHAGNTASNSGNGTYTEQVTTNQTSTSANLIRLQATGASPNNTFDITSVSVREVRSTTTTIEADGSSAGAATVSGTSGARAGTVNSITAAATVSGVPAAFHLSAGAVAGTNTTTADASPVLGANSTIVNAATATADSSATAGADGSANGTSTGDMLWAFINSTSCAIDCAADVLADACALALADSAIVGQGDANADVTQVQPCESIIDCTSDVVATTNNVARTMGSSTGMADVWGDIAGMGVLDTDGSSDGLSDVQGLIAAFAQSECFIDGTSYVDGPGYAVMDIVGQIEAAAIVEAFTQQFGVADGQAFGMAWVVGDGSSPEMIERMSAFLLFFF